MSHVLLEGLKRTKDRVGYSSHALVTLQLQYIVLARSTSHYRATDHAPVGAIVLLVATRDAIVRAIECCTWVTRSPKAPTTTQITLHDCPRTSNRA